MAKSNFTNAHTAGKTDAEKREALRGKIEAGEQRQAQRSFADQAKDAADGAVSYVRANPLKAVAAVAVGALVIGAMTRPGRNLGRKTGRLAGVASDAALAYGLSLLDGASGAASKGQGKLVDFGGAVGSKASAWTSAASREGSDLSDYLRSAAERSSKRAGKSISELRGRLSH